MVGPAATNAVRHLFGVELREDWLTVELIAAAEEFGKIVVNSNLLHLQLDRQ